MPRLVIVSNRLPVTVRYEHGQLSLARSPGGLANGLKGPHERMGGVWVGWPGDTSRLGDAQRGDLERQLLDLHAVPVYLSASEVARYYEGFSNGVLWPLFHYLLDRMPLDPRHFDAYTRVNERFAEAAAAHVGPGDLAWIHDYQLALVPRMLRRRQPDARIGFFLHIPFPSAEVMRTLPRRRELLEGMLGADLVGFHTRTYLRHFADSCQWLLGAEARDDRVIHAGREVRLGVFPMSVDARAISSQAADIGLIEEARALRHEDERLLLGIDRLDYTKGIPRRLLAMERMLERDAKLRGKARLVQVAVPSREKVAAYQDLRQLVEQLVGRINGMYATATRAPVHYIYRALPERQVIAWYRAADVMVVTPLRDGMNLVAKEFIAARPDEDGVLVISELAGAAEELPAALKVNPYDIEGVATTLRRALTMPEAERRARMRALRTRVLEYDVHAWAESFIAELEGTREAPTVPVPAASVTDGILARIRDAQRLVLLLDYDGTLVGFEPRPEQAMPDEELMQLLASLTRSSRTEVHLVSGRKREDMERWFGQLPVGLVAEHGLWMRPDRGAAWQCADLPSPQWMDVVSPLMDAAVGRLPGSHVERKTASLAFHWRECDPEQAEKRVRELRYNLMELARWLPIDVCEGNKVTEARVRGIHKGRVVAWLREAGRLNDAVVAIGDDRTDEDMFAALPAEAVSVLVGDRPTLARWKLPDPNAVRVLLRALVELRPVAPKPLEPA